jgi:hypothetical protein
MRYLIFVTLFLAACTTSSINSSERVQNSPESWANVDIQKLNTRIDEAVAADKSWPNSPLLLTLHLLGYDQGSQSVIFEEVKSGGERPEVTTISYIRDGFLDDSVRGDWYEVVLRLQPDGSWRISEARVAYRCWRGESKKAFRKEPCL